MTSSFDAEALADEFFEDWYFTDDTGPEHPAELADLIQRVHDAARREAFEEAAGVCERLAVDCEREQRDAEVEGDHGLSLRMGDKWVATSRAVLTIRALIDREPEPDCDHDWRGWPEVGQTEWRERCCECGATRAGGSSGSARGNDGTKPPRFGAEPGAEPGAGGQVACRAQARH